MATLQEALDSIGTTDYRHIVSLSGGKDSSALALYLSQRYPQISVEYVFCDTGAELPETYEYLDRLEAFLGKEIKRLSALDLLGVQHKPGRTAANHHHVVSTLRLGVDPVHRVNVGNQSAVVFVQRLGLRQTCRKRFPCFVQRRRRTVSPGCRLRWPAVNVCILHHSTSNRSRAI